MHDRTKKMLLDSKLTHYNQADSEFSEIGPPLIIGGNIGAYGRKVQELYANAIVNIVKDIFESEKKVLSRFTVFPKTQYFSSLKNEVLGITNREIHLLDEKFKNKLQPYATGPNTISLKDRLQSSMHDRINRAADQLQEEIRLLRPEKIKIWLGIIVSVPALIESYITIIKYLTGLVKSCAGAGL